MFVAIAPNSMKLTISIIAVVITFYVFIPYIAGIFRHNVRPHVFSWLIWAITTLIIFIAQITERAGVGAWPIGLSGILTCFVAILAFYKNSDISITRVDWMFFISALCAIPLWLMLSDPIWAVVLLTIIDLLGFGPTIRKAYHCPHEERIFFYFVYALRNLLVILALETHSVSTMIFPASICLACVLLCLLIWHRRRVSGWYNYHA